MTMTKQHFESIARALRAEDPRRNPEFHKSQLQTWESCVQAIAAVCAASNAQFKRDRFWEA